MYYDLSPKSSKPGCYGASFEITTYIEQYHHLIKSPGHVTIHVPLACAPPLAPWPPGLLPLPRVLHLARLVVTEMSGAGGREGNGFKLIGIIIRKERFY